jgi:hypothetical protein
MGTVYCLPSTSMVVRMPQHRCHNLSSSSWGGCPSAVWLLTLFFFAGLLNHSCSWSVYIMSWIVPLFYTILSCCGSKCYCSIDIGAMRDGVGWSPLSLWITHSCHVVEYPVSVHYARWYCYRYFVLCVNFCNCRLPEPGPIPRVLELVFRILVWPCYTSDAQADQYSYEHPGHYKRTYFLCANFFKMRYSSRWGFWPAL